MARPTTKPSHPTELGRRLRMARERLDLSQKELADRAGVTNSAVSNWEHGVNRTVKPILELARALRVSPDWLATGRGPMEPNRPAVSAEAIEIARRFESLTGPQRAVVLALLATFEDSPAPVRATTR